MKKYTISLSATVLLLASSQVWALSYDQSVNANGPTQIPAGNSPGIYFGSGGNANGGFTVDTENNIELGLRAHVRYDASQQAQNIFNSGGNGTYSFTDNNTHPSGRSSWNYDFSINVNQSGLGSATLASYTFWVAIDSDPSAGQSFTMYNPLLLPDNTPVPGNSIVMNSENAKFAIVGIPGYDNTIAGTYDIILTALNLDGSIAAQTFARIDVNGGTTSAPLTSVPDSASTLMLLGAGLSGFAFLRRKIAA